MSGIYGGYYQPPQQFAFDQMQQYQQRARSGSSLRRSTRGSSRGSGRHSGAAAARPFFLPRPFTNGNRCAILDVSAGTGKGADVYRVLSLVGAVLFVAANVWATTQRGYWAVGGEAFFLALPAYAWMARGIIETERGEA